MQLKKHRKAFRLEMQIQVWSVFADLQLIKENVVGVDTDEALRSAVLHREEERHKK